MSEPSSAQIEVAAELLEAARAAKGIAPAAEGEEDPDEEAGAHGRVVELGSSASGVSIEMANLNKVSPTPSATDRVQGGPKTTWDNNFQQPR